MEENKEAVVDFNVTSEVKFKPGGKKHYGKVRMTADGYFLFTGEFQLEIDELENEKNELSENKYEFLIQTPDGENGDPGECGKDALPSGEVTIIIHKLLNDVHIKGLGGNGGNGGDGIAGGNGGNGGDAAASDSGKGTGGCGGNGGDGGDGGNGGNGADAPKITMTYTGDDNHAKVIVLSEDNTPCDENLSYGGKGGKGGEESKGGMGGTGGFNGDGQTRAPGGTAGNNGNSGTNGQDGSNGYIIIQINEN